MGNTTVKPAPLTTTVPYSIRPSVSVFNPDIHAVPTESSTPFITPPTNVDNSIVVTKPPTPITAHSPTNTDNSTVPAKPLTPITTTSPTNTNHSTVPIKPLTPINATSPTQINGSNVPTKPLTPITTTSPTNTNHSTVAIKPPTPINATSPNDINSPNVPTKPRTPTPITITSPTNINRSTVPTKPFTPPVLSNAYNSSVPVVSTTINTSITPTIPATSSALAITELVSPTPTNNDISIKYSNFTPVASPDTSVVSPTIEHFITPRTSLIPPVSVNPTPSLIETRSIAPFTNNTSVSPTIPVVSTSPVISTTPLPAKVARKQSVFKNPRLPSTSTVEPTKSIALSSAERWDKWNKFERKQQENNQRISHISQESQILTVSTPPSSIHTNENQKITSVIPDIVALPSFLLRSTAVSNPPQDNHFLSERTQSIHTDVSIFKYYLSHKETQQSIGNHTKATMYQMNTRLKQTPLPIPSLSFLSKNFNDGTHELDNSSITTPTFDSLGLQNDLETESINQFSTKSHLHEEEKQQKHSSISDFNSSSNDSIQFVTSTIFNQPYSSSTEKPLVSILKKPSSQVINNPFSIQTNKKIDFEDYPSTVSFKIPSSSTTTNKASQSILRSEHLFSNRSFYQKK